MDFRSFLQTELDRRRTVNRRYTLRSFARWLQIDHASLSQILRGKRNVGTRALTAIGTRLKIDPIQMARYREKEVDRSVIAGIKRSDFKPASRWLATRLGLSVDEVNIAIQRLLRTGRLLMAGGSDWRIQ